MLRPIGQTSMRLLAALIALASSPLAIGQTCAYESDDAVGHEYPWLLYADQNCPSGETGLVDDAAVFEGRYDPLAGNLSESSTYTTNKAIGGLARPAGIVIASDALFWCERDAGTVKRCEISFSSAGCIGEPVTLLSGLNCPQDIAIDFGRGHLYVIQYGGGTASDASERCRGDARITRVDLFEAVDGSSGRVDVVTTGLVAPQYLAIDPLWNSRGRSGALFWTDQGAIADGSLMRSFLDGTYVVNLLGAGIAFPSGVALDSKRQAVYVTQQVRGASIIACSYEGGSTVKHLSRYLFFEPRALSVDPSDGAVYVVETDSFEAGCDPTSGGGLGAYACPYRDKGRISRVSCSWPAGFTTDGQTPAPFQCCCAGASWGCTLSCEPPAARPSPPPALPPGVNASVNGSASAASVPVLERDYGTLLVDNETLLTVGGFLISGSNIQSWGDPSHLRVLPAVRLPPLRPGLPRELSYGSCPPGCGRPSGSDACVTCLQGSFGTGNGICVQCGAGTFGNATAASGAVAASAASCAPCPPGRYNPSFGATECRPCPLGSFCRDGYALDAATNATVAAPLQGGIPLPVGCPAGTYNDATLGTSPSSCKACPSGRARSMAWGTSVDDCDVCPAGTMSGGAGSSACLVCTPGRYAPTASSSTCEPCPLGHHNASSGALSCSPCPLGSHGPELAGTDPECLGCPAGRYAETIGSSSCAPCVNGTASSSTRAATSDTCQTCPVGRYVLPNATAATSCLPCPNQTEIVDAYGMLTAEPPSDRCVYELSGATSLRGSRLEAGTTLLLAAAASAAVVWDRAGRSRRH